MEWASKKKKEKKEADVSKKERTIVQKTPPVPMVPWSGCLTKIRYLNEWEFDEWEYIFTGDDQI